jgi:thiol-disulfide isomerase/thioredoxin
MADVPFLMLSNAELKARHARGLTFPDYLRTAKPGEKSGWDAFTAKVSLTSAQHALVASFTRRINILTISGTWCGDCVQQVPIIAAIAAANPLIDLRLIDRDENLDFAEHFKICGGHRVPAVIFMNEDFDFISLMGDKTLARFRRQAAGALGASCPLPGAPVPADEVAAVTQDWLNEFERVALLCRLSAKLRQRHGD